MISGTNKTEIPLVSGDLQEAVHSASLKSFFIALSLLALLFSKPLFDLGRYAFQESFYSHIILIPFISAYLLRQTIPSPLAPARGSLAVVASLSVLGLLVLSICAIVHFSLKALSLNDYLSGTIFSFVCFLLASCEWFLGRTFVRAALFPLLFLFFMVPFPEVFTNFLEIAFQHASAQCYAWLMDLSRASYFREGLVFALPNLTIRVAQECSGIRSSFVLFITSLIAGFLFLKSPWRRATFSLLVIPLGVLRNAIRIYFLSMASAYWNPNIIHSPLHHRGGPIFFVLSLVPLFVLLFWFRKSEARQLPSG